MASASPKLKSNVSRPSPLSLPSFGSRVANFTAIDGRVAVSGANRILAPIEPSGKSDVEVAVGATVSIEESGAGVRFVIENMSRRPPLS